MNFQKDVVYATFSKHASNFIELFMELAHMHWEMLL